MLYFVQYVFALEKCTRSEMENNLNGNTDWVPNLEKPRGTIRLRIQKKKSITWYTNLEKVPGFQV